MAGDCSLLTINACRSDIFATPRKRFGIRPSRECLETSEVPRWLWDLISLLPAVTFMSARAWEIWAAACGYVWLSQFDWIMVFSSLDTFKDGMDLVWFVWIKRIYSVLVDLIDLIVQYKRIASNSRYSASYDCICGISTSSHWGVFRGCRLLGSGNGYSFVALCNEASSSADSPVCFRWESKTSFIRFN